MSPAVRDKAGILVHTVQSEYQSAKTKIRVLLPRPLEKGKRYAVLYVLPVETADGRNRATDCWRSGRPASTTSTG